MKIDLTEIKTDFDKKRCYVHARGLIMPDGFGLITTQKLELSGCDVFYGIEMMKTEDGGKSFGAPSICEGLKRIYREDGSCYTICDATPFYHKKSGKIILTGHLANYSAKNALTDKPIRREPVYAVYDCEKGDFSPVRVIEMPRTEDDLYFSSGSGCSQICENDEGELLIPFYTVSYERIASGKGMHAYAGVMRCAFDGERIELIEIGNTITVDVERGFCEPSIIGFGGEYFVALRNDLTGYVTKSRDGIHLDEPVELCFDDGESLGSYNTQQHWLVGGGRLWLVYTRRAGNNDHVFRHRAPLFIAELDPKTMRVLRHTERIAVPERGARLGNFGCQSFSDKVGYVYAAEWMQGDRGLEGCMAHGSDNTIFVSRITFD